MRERESILHDGCALCSDFNCDDSCVISDEGKCNIIVGFLCFALLALAVYGFRLGLRGLNERDKKYITCKVGIGVNGLVLAGIAAIFIRGLV